MPRNFENKLCETWAKPNYETVIVDGKIQKRPILLTAESILGASLPSIFYTDASEVIGKKMLAPPTRNQPKRSSETSDKPYLNDPMQLIPLSAEEWGAMFDPLMERVKAMDKEHGKLYTPPYWVQKTCRLEGDAK
jgi:hypothetical protein